MPSKSHSSIQTAREAAGLWGSAFAKLDDRRQPGEAEEKNPKTLLEAVERAVFLASDFDRPGLAALFEIWGERMRPGAALAVLGQQEREEARGADGDSALEAISQLWAQAARAGWVDEAFAREQKNRLGQRLAPYLWGSNALFEPALAVSAFKNERVARDLFGPQALAAWRGALEKAMEAPAAATLASGSEVAQALRALGALAPELPGALGPALAAFAAGPPSWRTPRWEGDSLQEERLAREACLEVFESLAPLRERLNGQEPPVCALIARSIAKGVGALAQDAGQAELSARALEGALAAGFNPSQAHDRDGSPLRILTRARLSHMADAAQKELLHHALARCAQSLLEKGASGKDLREGSLREDLQDVYLPEIKAMIVAREERSALLEQALGLNEVETADLKEALEAIKAKKAPSAPKRPSVGRL